MNKSNCFALRAAFAALAGAVLGGCTLEDMPNDCAAMPGDPVVLDVASSVTSNAYSNMSDSAAAAQTRVSFSGKSFSKTGESKKERIDWTVGDQVDFYLVSADYPSPETQNEACNTQVMSRYVKEVSNTDETSRVVKFEKGEGDGSSANILTWMPGRQVFYGLHGFASASYKGDNNSCEQSYMMAQTDFPNRTVAKGKQSAEKSVVYVGGDLPMYAHYGPVTVSEGIKTLSFAPAASVFQVTLGNSGDKPKVIKSLCLSTERAGKESMSGVKGELKVYQSGKTEYALTESGTAYYTVYADVPSDGVKVEKGNTVTFFMYANPVKYSGLSLLLSYAEVNGGTEGTAVEKKLDIKKDGSWYPFDAFRKYNISVDAPQGDEGYIYVFNMPDVSLQATNTLGRVKVTSYRYPKKKSNVAENREAVDWVMDAFSTDGGNTWRNVSWNATTTAGSTDWWKSSSNTYRPSWVKEMYVNSLAAGSIGGMAYDWSGMYKQDAPTTGPAVLTYCSTNTAEGTANNNRTWHGTTSWANTDHSLGSDVYNLACYDIFGNLNYTGKMTTANCYVIRQPGYYMLPLVYGNAITNGVVLQRPAKNQAFVDGRGYNIEAGLTYIYGVQSVRVIWSDAPCIEGGGFVTIGKNSNEQGWTFTVQGNKIKNGNTLIGAFDDSGTCIWAWHIWITDEDLGDKTFYGNSLSNSTKDFGVSRSYTTGEAYTYRFLNRPLGWYSFGSGASSRSIKVRFQQRVYKDGVWGEALNSCVVTFTQAGSSSQRQGGCLFYQWGRPWPQVGIGTNGALLSVSGNYTPETLIDPSSPSAVALTQPWNFVALTGGRQWFAPDYQDKEAQRAWLWNKRSGTVYGTGNVTEKTLYDPCPPGYCVPSRDAGGSLCASLAEVNIPSVGVASESYHLRQTDNPSTSDYGVYVMSQDGSELFLPATRYRKGEDGAVSNANGYFWTSSLCSRSCSGGAFNAPYYMEVTTHGTIAPYSTWVSTCAGMCVLPQKYLDW